MKQLPLVKNYSGDGFAASPQVLTQVQRTESVAMYSRAVQSTPALIYGYEVFTIVVVKAGTSLPGGKVVEEDYEQYPGAKAFGKRAWFLGGKKARVHADTLYQTLLLKGVELKLDSEQEKINMTINEMNRNELDTGTWPTTPFTIKQLEAKSGIPYAELRKQVQAAMKTGVLEVSGTLKGERRGKPAVLYSRI